MAHNKDEIDDLYKEAEKVKTTIQSIDKLIERFE